MRCPSCGYLLGDKQIKWEEEIEKIINSKLTSDEKTKKRAKLLDTLKVENYCCRTRMLGPVDVFNISYGYSNLD